MGTECVDGSDRLPSVRAASMADVEDLASSSCSDDEHDLLAAVAGHVHTLVCAADVVGDLVGPSPSCGAVESSASIGILVDPVSVGLLESRARRNPSRAGAA